MHSANLRACVNRSLSGFRNSCVFTVSEVLTFSFELEGNNKVFVMDVELVSSEIVLVGFKERRLFWRQGYEMILMRSKYVLSCDSGDIRLFYLNDFGKRRKEETGDSAQLNKIDHYF